MIHQLYVIILTNSLWNWFRELKEEGLFSMMESELIAIAFIYLLIIRRNVDHFTHIWNIHSIRKQKNRPWLIPGKPYLNFFHPKSINPDAVDCGRPIHLPVLQELKDSLISYGNHTIILLLKITRSSTDIFIRY